MTRRELIWRAAQAGGYSAALVLMRSMDLLASPQGPATPVQLAPNTGRGTKVAIIGAGVAGLIAAYEMRRSGFDCTVLEARTRPGGRNWTICRGDKVEFADGTAQQCAFDEGQYFNAGAARIPAIHRTILGDRLGELGVPVEVLVNSTRATLLQSDHAFGGRPVEQRQAINDTRGHVAELLAKAIRRGALDEEVTRADRERMLAFSGDVRGSELRVPLQGFKPRRREAIAWRRTAGTGRSRAIGVERAAGRRLLAGHPLRRASRHAGDDVPTGRRYGPDPDAFAQKLGAAVKFGCPVSEIRKTTTGVRIVYDERGTPRVLDA